MGRWSSLFLPYANPALLANQIVADRLKAGLQAMGYELYNPFAVGPGKAYANAVKLFVCPGNGRWVGVIAAPEPASMMAELGLGRVNLAYDPFPFCLTLALDDTPNGETTALIDVYVNGEKGDPLTLLADYLQPGKTIDHLRAALSGNSAPPTPASSAPPAAAAFDAMPDDIKAMAAQVNPDQAKKLVSRLSQTLMGKLGGSLPGTGDLLRGTAPAWDSPAGRTVTALATCITLPPGWLSPDFASVRDAYALAVRRQTNPGMTLLPGDQDIIDAVPQVMRYTPVYAGKS